VGAWIETRLIRRVSVVVLKSRPAWARGLKHKAHKELIKSAIVAPCVGAWIETDGGDENHSQSARRALRGRVD